MFKNILLGVYTLLLVLSLIALATDRLAWVSEGEDNNGERIELLGKAIEMHRPEVLEMGEIQILHVPISKLSGRHYSVNHEFYIYEDGTLKSIDFKSK